MKSANKMILKEIEINMTEFFGFRFNFKNRIMGSDISVCEAFYTVGYKLLPIIFVNCGEDFYNTKIVIGATRLTKCFSLL